MMKRLFILLFILCSLQAFSQPVTGSFGASGTTTLFKGSAKVSEFFFLPGIVSGTPSWAGAARYNPADSSMYLWTGYNWVKSGGTSIDTFTLATRRYVDSSTAVYGSRLYDTYNTHDTLTQSRFIDLNDAFGLTFTVDGTNDLATGINASGFTSKRSKHDFTANNGWIYGQLHDPAQVYKTRFQVIGLVNDSTHSAQLISTNNNNYNKKAALVSAGWSDGVKLQTNVNWTTSGNTSGYKGIYVYSTAGDGTGQVKIDREVLSVGSSTDSALVRKSDGTLGLYPVSGGGGGSTTLSTLTYGATTTWNYATQGAAAKVTLTGNTTLSITNLPASVVYLSLTVIQDATGSRTITLPAGTKVISGGAGAVTLTTTGGASDKLTFEWDGTTLWCNYGLNYN